MHVGNSNSQQVSQNLLSFSANSSDEEYCDASDKVERSSIDLLQKESCCLYGSLFPKKSDFKVHYRSETYYPGHFLTLKKYSIFVLQQVSYKRYRKKSLTDDQKEHNRKLASFRMRVEHKIREIKVFKIMSHIYRNFQKKYNMRFNIIAGLVNLKHEF